MLICIKTRRDKAIKIAISNDFDRFLKREHPLCTQHALVRNEKDFFLFSKILWFCWAWMCQERKTVMKRRATIITTKKWRRAEKQNLSIAIDPTMHKESKQYTHSFGDHVTLCLPFSIYICYTLLRHYLFNSSYIMVRSIYDKDPFFSVRNTWIDVSILNAKYSELKKSQPMPETRKKIIQ